jgi:hypothetical protein
MVSLFLVLASPAAAAEPAVRELNLYPTIQYFTWEEFFGGNRLLKESGLLYGVGGTVQENFFRQDNGFMPVKAKLELFGGLIDYNGQTQKSTNQALSQINVSTDVAHIGVKGEVDTGWRFSFPGGNVGPFVGLGYRWWLRDILNSTATDRNGQSVDVGGYTEEWQTLYARFGGHLDYLISTNSSLYCEGGGRYPLFTQNSADFPGTGMVDLRPAARWSAFAEIGAEIGRFRPALYYEGMRFGQSDPVRIGSNMTLLQPESHSDIFGMSLSYRF